MDQKVERKNGTWPAAVVGLLGAGLASLMGENSGLAIGIMAVAGPLVAALAVRAKVWLSARGIDVNGGV